MGLLSERHQIFPLQDGFSTLALLITSRLRTNQRYQPKTKDGRKNVNYIVTTQSADGFRNHRSSKAHVTSKALSKAIVTGKWLDGDQQSGVGIAGFAAWQKAEDELTVGVNLEVIFRGRQNSNVNHY